MSEVIPLPSAPTQEAPRDNVIRLNVPTPVATPREMDRDAAFYGAATDIPMEEIRASVESGIQSTIAQQARSQAQAGLVSTIEEGLTQEDFDTQLIGAVDELRQIELFSRFLPQSTTAALRANVTGSREFALDRTTRVVMLNEAIQQRIESMGTEPTVSVDLSRGILGAVSVNTSQIVDFAEMMVDPLDAYYQTIYRGLTTRLEALMAPTVPIEEYQAGLEEILSEAQGAGLFSSENRFNFYSFLDTFGSGIYSGNQRANEILSFIDLTGTLGGAAAGATRTVRALNASQRASTGALLQSTALTTGVLARGAVSALRDASRDSLSMLGLMRPSARTNQVVQDVLTRAVMIDDPRATSTIVPAHTHSSLATPTLIRGGYLSAASNAAIRNFELTSTALQRLRETSVASGQIFDPETIEVFTTRFVADRMTHLRTTGQTRIMDVEVGVDDFNNLFFQDVLGTVSGNYFRRQSDANRAAQFGDEVVMVGQNQWAVLRRMPIDVDNLETLRAEGYTADIRGMDLYRATDPEQLGEGFFARWGSVGPQADPAMSANLFLAEGAFNRQVHLDRETLKALERSMSRRQVAETYRVWDHMAGLQRRTAFTRAEFDQWFTSEYGRAPTDAQLAYYVNTQELLDAEALVQANFVYANAVRMGTRRLRVSEGVEMNVIPVSRETLSPTTRLYSEDQGRTIGVDEIPEGQQIFRNMDYEDFPGNVQYFTSSTPQTRGVRVSDFVVRNSGGHRSYITNQMQFIAKQPNVRVYEDGSERVLAPRTLFAGRNRDDVIRGVDEVNRIIDEVEQAFPPTTATQRMSSENFLTYIRGAAGTRFDNVVNNNNSWNRSITTFDDLVTTFRDRGIDLRRRFQNVAEGDPLEAMARLDDSVFAVRGMTQADELRVSMMRGGRGTQSLMEYGGGSISTHSSQRSIQGAVTGTIARMTETAYRVRTANGIIKAALDSGVMKEGYNTIRNLPTRTQIERILRDDLIDVSGAKGAKENIGRRLQLDLRRLQFRLNQTTWFNQKWRSGVRSAANALYGRGKLANKIVESMDRWSGDPVSALRGMAFDAYLGMFNPAQLLMQGMQFINVFAIGGANALKAAALYGPMRMMLNNGHPAVRARMAGLMKPLTGLDLADYDIMLEMFERSGRGVVTNNLAELSVTEDAMSHLGRGAARDAVSGFRERGRFFFKEGDLFARMTAFTTSYLNYVERVGRRPTSWQDWNARRWISNEEQRLTQYMTTASRQSYEQAPFMQFMTYQLRIYEALLAGTFNNTKKVLTRAEKWRFLGTQVTLFGAFAFAPTEALLNYVEAHYDVLPADWRLREAYQFMSRGLMDYVASELTGLDTGLSSRFSSAGMIWEQLFELSQGNLFTFAIGPSGQFGTRLVDSLFGMTVNGLSTALAPTELTENRVNDLGFDLLDLVRLTSTGNQLYNAANAVVWGEYYNRQYSRVSDDISAGDGVFMLFGVLPDQVNTIYNYLGQRRFLSMYLDHYADNITADWNRYFLAQRNGDREHAQELLDRITFQFQALTPMMREQVERRVRDNPVPLVDQLLLEMFRTDNTTYERVTNGI